MQLAEWSSDRTKLEITVQEAFATLDKRIHVQTKSDGNALQLRRAKIHSQEYKFHVDGFELCQFQAKAHETIHGSVTVIGTIPDVQVTESFHLDQWPDIRASVESTDIARFDEQIEDRFRLVDKKPCLWVDGDSLIRVWQLDLEADRLRYKAVSDDENLYNFHKNYFSADGTATVYSTNPKDGVLTEYAVRNLIPDSDGTVLVENDRFITLLDTNEYDYFADSSAPYSFNPDPDSDEFKEVSLFTNGNRVIDYLENLGYQNFGSEAMRVVVHASFGSDTNNALYQPGEEFSTIFVGNGDGEILQNLAVDYDVMSHELGHHVVYHSIQTIQGNHLCSMRALPTSSPSPAPVMLA